MILPFSSERLPLKSWVGMVNQPHGRSLAIVGDYFYRDALRRNGDCRGGGIRQPKVVDARGDGLNSRAGTLALLYRNVKARRLVEALVNRKCQRRNVTVEPEIGTDHDFALREGG